jgi:hypothetical protein
MNDSRFILQAINAETGWLDIRAITEPVSYIATGNFPGGTIVSIRYSNNELVAKGTDFTTDPQTIVAAVGPLQLPARIARFINFVMTGFAGGANVVVSFAKGGSDSRVRLVDIVPQSAALGNGA